MINNDRTILNTRWIYVECLHWSYSRIVSNWTEHRLRSDNGLNTKNYLKIMRWLLTRESLKTLKIANPAARRAAYEFAL